VPVDGEPAGVERLPRTADTGVAVTAPTFELCLTEVGTRDWADVVEAQG